MCVRSVATVANCLGLGCARLGAVAASEPEEDGIVDTVGATVGGFARLCCCLGHRV